MGGPCPASWREKTRVPWGGWTSASDCLLTAASALAWVVGFCGFQTFQSSQALSINTHPIGSVSRENPNTPRLSFEIYVHSWGERPREPLAHSKSYVGRTGLPPGSLTPPPGAPQCVFPVTWQPWKEVGECLGGDTQESHICGISACALSGAACI